MNIDTKTPWPLGAHRGKPAHSLPSPYLFWATSVDDFRRAYPGATRLALAVLRDRFHAPGRIEEELGVSPGVVGTRTLPGETEPPAPLW